MASYRLIDELPNAQKRKPPFPPLGLFFLTWLFMPLAIPFWFVNWGRLGHPEKRLLCLIAGIAAFVVSIALGTTLLNRESAKMARTLFMFAYAYYQLYGQRPLYEAHLNRGGQKAPAWPLWLTALVGVALIVFVSSRA